MEEDHLICYCNEVHKSTIVQAIKEKNLKTVEEVGEETGAGQVCGQCQGDIRKLLDEIIGT
ncbi:MAG: (2Fe-2S)-binding protein [Bacteroidales bacterium]|jgi:bacterioferritin-associated ferredoxin|nr:(2Fe-2S)-binding protein [Bacteroidales bacterium]HKM30840.1 (2Fe-2S)-binding protein [Bacteroidales bacterium]